MLRDNAPKVSLIPPLCAINHRMHPSDRARETVSGIFPLLARERQLIDDPGKLALVREALMIRGLHARICPRTTCDHCWHKADVTWERRRVRFQARGKADMPRRAGNVAL
jgi:hypothetical protein